MIAVNKLKYLMLLSGISSKELALATQVERSTLIKILNGSTARPRIDTIHSLAKYFNVDVAELIDTQHSGLKIPMSQSKELKSILANLMTVNGINSATLLTKYTGISASMICDILNGKTQHPHVSTLQRLAEFFNVTVPQLNGIDAIPVDKIAEITPLKKSLPLLSLEQVGGWVNGNGQDINKYINITRSVIGDKAYALNITNNKFMPDFTSNHTLIIDNNEKIAENNFVVCEFNNQISIFECSMLTDENATMREAGQFEYFTVELSKINIFGVVVQQVLNRKAL